ncbi:hypothetical protein [Peribacillus glennii]|nr:hypothetical protein [Peribacillus glennii]
MKRKKKAHSTKDASVNVESLPTNRNEHPEIGSRGRGPVILDDQNATMLNEGIFENTHREYFDGDLYR